MNIMSTNCDPNSVTTVPRRQKDGSRPAFPCPESIKKYVTYMRGVDRADQLRSYYKVRTRSRKPYKYIFWFLLEVAIVNSYILSKSSPFKSFRLQLAKELIGSYCSRKLSGRGSNQRRPLQILHFPLKIGSTTTSATKHKRDRCELCKKNKTRKDTSFRCHECNVWLCHTGDEETDCFYKWHAKNMH